MRLIFHSILFLMVAGLLAGAVVYHRNANQQTQAREITRDEVRTFQRHVSLQSALEIGPVNDRGYPATLDPNWFESSELPANPLLGRHHPWAEVANHKDRYLRHPPDWAVNDPAVARFWYNPYLGIVRARVPLEVSEDVSRENYNYVNDSDLISPLGSTPEGRRRTAR